MPLYIMGNMLKIESHVTFAPLCTGRSRSKMNDLKWMWITLFVTKFDVLLIHMNGVRKAVEKLHKDSRFPGRQ